VDLATAPYVKPCGVKLPSIRTGTYAIAGACAAWAGCILTEQVGLAVPYQGAGYELDVIAAVILGGAALTGGRGSIFGVILGAALMGVLRNAFVLLGVSAYWQVVTIGVVVILAVGIDSVRRQEGV